MYHRYLQLFNIGQILVIKTYLCSSNRYKNSTILININISLLYACILVQYIEETSGRTDPGRQAGRHRHNLSIPYVNGGTLLFQLPPIRLVNNIVQSPKPTFGKIPLGQLMLASNLI